MRYLMIVEATPDSESGELDNPEAFEEMGRYNQELVRAGVAEARTAFERAAALTRNEGERALLRDRADTCATHG
jgi:predicted RNA polymerase sigma factor